MDFFEVIATRTSPCSRKETDMFLYRQNPSMTANKSVDRPNNAFKPKLHRYAVHMAERACHVGSYALQFGLT